MRIEDNRRDNKGIMFKDLEVGRVFEHVELNMIMIKFDNSDFGYNRNALRIDSDADTKLWHVSPDSKVIPVNAKLVIEEG
jgi:hypothetical protein